MAAMTTPLAGAGIAQLEADGIDTVIGTVVNPAGLTHAKTVPIQRTSAFANPGLGASPVWHGFAIDRAGIAFTEGISVVGDERVRIDLEGLRVLGDGLAWAPGAFFDQDGQPVPSCARGTLARIESRLADAGLRAARNITPIAEVPDGSGGTLEETTYVYNLQGRMSQTLLDQDGDGTVDAIATLDENGEVTELAVRETGE